MTEDYFIDKAKLILGNGEWISRDSQVLLIAKDNLTSIYENGEGLYRYYIDNKNSFSFARNSDATSSDKEDKLVTVPTDFIRTTYNSDGRPGILFEPARTNLCLRSEEFNTWSINGSPTVTANQVTAPNDELTADELTSTSLGDYIYRNTPITDTDSFAYSLFVKNIDSTQTRLLQSGTDIEVLVNWNGNDIDSVTGGDFRAYVNGWYRVWGIGVSSTSSSQRSRIYADFSGNGGSIYVWGADVENGTYVTSYIKTEASSVTRARDADFEGSYSGMTGTTEGTIVFSFEQILPNDTLVTYSVWRIKSGATEQLRLISIGTADGMVIYDSRNGIYPYGSLTVNGGISSKGVIAITYSPDEMKFAVDGVVKGSGYNPTTAYDQIDYIQYDENCHKGLTTNTIATFDYFMSDEELIALTTL